MSPDQVNNLIRDVLRVGGPILATWFVRKGILSTEDVTFLGTQAPALLGIAMTIAGVVMGMVSHKQANMVATVDAMPEVQRIITQPTAAGIALADAVPSTSVVSAGAH